MCVCFRLSLSTSHCSPARVSQTEIGWRVRARGRVKGAFIIRQSRIYTIKIIHPHKPFEAYVRFACLYIWKYACAYAKYVRPPYAGTQLDGDEWFKKKSLCLLLRPCARFYIKDINSDIRITNLRVHVFVKLCLNFCLNN